jgi:hypothetical protein
LSRVGVLELPGGSLTGIQLTCYRLVIVKDLQIILAGLGEIGDERLVLDRLLPLLGIQFVHVRATPAQHIYQDDGQNYEDDEVQQSAASQDSAQSFLPSTKCV